MGRRRSMAIPDAVPAPPREVWRETWWTGPYPEGFRSGASAYTHMIRDPSDPERSEREARKGQENRVVKEIHRHGDVESFKKQILAHVADGTPRTLNRIAMELWDLTADIVGERIEKAFFDLVEEMKLQHTVTAPILWLPVWPEDSPPPLLPRHPDR